MFQTCLNYYRDLMVAARVGKDYDYRDLMDMFDKLLVTTLVKMTLVLDTYHGPYLRFYGALSKTGTPKKRSPLLEHECPCVVCVYHVGQDPISKSPRICGEALACMFFECFRFQVDVIAGSGNKACYLATPKAGGCPTYEVSLLQFWINRVIHTATQARLKNYGKAPAVRVNHLLFLQRPCILGKHFGINTNTYTHELAKKIENAGDCCMLSSCEWAHARLEFEEDISDFDDQSRQSHMDFVGEFSFSVNEAC